MKEVFVQLRTFEIIKAQDEELSREMGVGFSSKQAQQRFVAILLALEELGFVTSSDRGRETWFSFDPSENLAGDVIRIKLSKSKMVHSIELSRRIAPTIKELWSRSVVSALWKGGGAQNKKIELDPFVYQLVLWIDKEIVEERPQFGTLDLTGRMARICLELQKRGVAIRAGTNDVSAWLTAAEIDQRIGGAKISGNTRFTVTSDANAALLGQFHLAISAHLKRRLASMLEIEEGFFQLCNTGMMKIAEISAEGHYHWEVTDEGRRAYADSHPNILR